MDAIDRPNIQARYEGSSTEAVNAGRGVKKERTQSFILRYLSYFKGLYDKQNSAFPITKGHSVGYFAEIIGNIVLISIASSLVITSLPALVAASAIVGGDVLGYASGYRVFKKK